MNLITMIISINQSINILVSGYLVLVLGLPVLHMLVPASLLVAETAQRRKERSSDGEPKRGYRNILENIAFWGLRMSQGPFLQTLPKTAMPKAPY